VYISFALDTTGFGACCASIALAAIRYSTVNPVVIFKYVSPEYCRAIFSVQLFFAVPQP
jgi:hypothetical protein